MESMADLLVRGLDGKVMARLKKRAKVNGRSLQAEAKGILERAAVTLDIVAAREAITRLARKISGKRMPDSTIDIRKDRGR